MARSRGPTNSHRETASEGFAPPVEVLPDGSVVLSLGEPCIQTAAKNAHAELAVALLDGDRAADERGIAVDLLAAFLEGTDFADLRAAHPELNGTARRRVRVFREETGAASWEVVQSP